MAHAGAQRLSASTNEPLSSDRSSRLDFESAQRLSASTNEPRRVSPYAERRISRCSTPFGINERTTRAIVSRSDSGRVLNAFRHQRTNHRPGRAGPCDRFEVLNAFRHQRTNHQPSIADVRTDPWRAQRLSASTNEPLERSAHDGDGPGVLNAFRHQRTNHIGHEQRDRAAC